MHQETLYQDSISIRTLPVNFDEADLGLFEHELNKVIPATVLLNLQGVVVNPSGLLFRKGKVLPESFPSPRFIDTSAESRLTLKSKIKNYLLRYHKAIERDVFWFTDTWSQQYFHWITDALPRLFTIRGSIGNACLMLPGAYAGEEYIKSSLKPFSVQNLKFIDESFYCKSLKVPTRTASTGNYNEMIIRDLRSLYTDFYQGSSGDGVGAKIYVSRRKAQKRKIANEEECIAVLSEYGFKTVYFEDYSFERQVKIALDTRYLISNHGAGLTNILFMKSGSSVLELRQNGDANNNCYFALASALRLKYFYQLCRSENSDEYADTANLIVDRQLLRKNIELMLAN